MYAFIKIILYIIYNYIYYIYNCKSGLIWIILVCNSVILQIGFSLKSSNFNLCLFNNCNISSKLFNLLFLNDKTSKFCNVGNLFKFFNWLLESDNFLQFCNKDNWFNKFDKQFALRFICSKKPRYSLLLSVVKFNPERSISKFISWSSSIFHNSYILYLIMNWLSEKNIYYLIFKNITTMMI